MDIQHVSEHHMIEHRGHCVSIGIITETGEWVAMRSVTPMFCFVGDTCDAVEQKARHGLDFWATEIPGKTE